MSAYSVGNEPCKLFHGGGLKGVNPGALADYMLKKYCWRKETRPRKAALSSIRFEHLSIRRVRFDGIKVCIKRYHFLISRCLYKIWHLRREKLSMLIMLISDSGVLEDL